MNINKTTLNNFRSDFNEAMKALEAKYDVSVELTKIKYGDDQFEGKIAVANNGENGEKVSIAARDFTNMANQYGLKASDLGRTFKSGGKSFKISGLKPRNFKMPIIASCTDGKSYKFSENIVRNALV